jgi:hypothetical protein
VINDRALKNPTVGYISAMVVVHRAHGFRFVIYTSDHEPAHIHVTGPGHAKVNLLGADGRPETLFSVGIKRGEMKRLLSEIAKHQTDFLEAWERIHGKSDR